MLRTAFLPSPLLKRRGLNYPWYIMVFQLDRSTCVKPCIRYFTQGSGTPDYCYAVRLRSQEASMNKLVLMIIPNCVSKSPIRIILGFGQSLSPRRVKMVDWRFKPQLYECEATVKLRPGEPHSGNALGKPALSKWVSLCRSSSFTWFPSVFVPP